MTFESPRNLIQRGARTYRDKVAVISHGETITYGDLSSQTAHLSKKLKTIGVGPGAQVALALPNSLAYLVWYFGVLETGAVIVPFPPSSSVDETKRLFDSYDIQLLVVSERQSLGKDLGLSQVFKIDLGDGTSLFKDKNKQLAPKFKAETLHGTPPWTKQGILCRQFSSGSTGRPKTMLKTELNIEHDYRHFCETLFLGEQETFFGVAPFHHTYGAMSFMAAFYMGACVVVLPFFLPAPVLDAALQYKPTLFLTTPPMIDILGSCRIKAGQEKAFGNLKACICSTGHLRIASQKLFSSRYEVAVKVQYGSTETLSATIDLDDDFEEGRVGRPYKGVKIGIFNDNMDPCLPGMHGSVGIISPSASHRYEGDPDSTGRVFKDGYVFPGDRGFIDGSGRLHILGRSDIINIGGNKVDRLEVETVIKNSLPVRDVVVLESQQGGLPVIQAVIEADPEKVTMAEVIYVCQNQLIDYKVPRIVKIYSSLKRDTNGKILLKYLNA